MSVKIDSRCQYIFCDHLLFVLFPTIEKKIPRVVIVFDGGFDTLKTVRDSIKNDCPVIVIAESGHTADLLSEAYNFTKKG